jgi:hypothetical protein
MLLRLKFLNDASLPISFEAEIPKPNSSGIYVHLLPLWYEDDEDWSVSTHNKAVIEFIVGAYAPIFVIFIP